MLFCCNEKRKTPVRFFSKISQKKLEHAPIGIRTTHGIESISSHIISRVTFVIRASVTDGGTRRVKPREYKLLYWHYRIKYYLSAD